MDRGLLQRPENLQCMRRNGRGSIGTYSDRANYQQAAACEVCGETVGTPLQADFDKYGFTYETETDKEYPFTTKCYKSDDLTTGNIVFSDYETFASDDKHEEKEGYEWKTITYTIVFDDENAWKHGMGGYGAVREDFYDCSYSDNKTDENDDAAEDSFTVNYNGKDYTECIHESELLKEQWVEEANGTAYYEGQWKHIFRVPAGYTGITLSIFDDEVRRQLGDEVDSLEDVMLYKGNEHTVTFRLN